MKTLNEYVRCSCGGWARIERAEDRQHRDRIICSKCGGIVVMDNIPKGYFLRLKEDDENDVDDGEGAD